MRNVLVLLSMLALVGCGGGFRANPYNPLPPDGEPQPDGSIVRARAIINVDNSENAYAKVFKKMYETLIMPIAYAFTGPNPTATVTVSYSNAESVNFTLDTSDLGSAITLNGNTLELGSIEVLDLDDNKLKVCSSPTKCQQAAIRVYTTGSMSGFINTTDGDHSAPVYISGINPSTAVGLTSTNSIDITQRTIPSNDNKLTIDELSETLFDVTADFSNAGAGDYEMQLVIEYVLRNP